MRSARVVAGFVWLLFGAIAVPTAWSNDGEKADDADKQSKKVTLASFTIKEDYPEGPEAGGLFGELMPSLRETIRRLHSAAKDDKIKGIVLQLRGPEVGLGKVNELRDAIAQVRKAGKKVYADVQSVSSRDYMIASACDQIIMPPSGDVMINGLQAEVVFYKGLLDKLGVTADFIQVGDYKGASEPLTRTEMSPEFRKQFEAVIDDYYQQMVTTIAEDRKLTPERVKELIDDGLFTAERAKEVGLIDRVCYEDEFREQLKGELQTEELAFERNYGKQKVDTDFSGLTGFMKFMDLMSGADARKNANKDQAIALIYAVGPIMPGESASSIFGGSTVGGDTIVKAIRKAEEDDKIKAIILRVDSPGGSALASDLIWREVVRAKKPVIASMGDTAASGGYYISMGADKIFVEPGTLTGSIGVVGGKLVVKGLMDKLGVQTEVIRRGKHSGTLSMNEPFSESEREAWKRMMSEIYKQFTTKAAEGRKMELSKLEELAQGRLFSGRMAVENGLADKIGTLNDAVAEAKEMSGLGKDDKVELRILPEPKSFFEQLFEGPSLETEARAIAPQLKEGLQAAELFQKLFREPVITVMPFEVEIR